MVKIMFLQIKCINKQLVFDSSVLASKSTNYLIAMTGSFNPAIPGMKALMEDIFNIDSVFW